MTLDALLFDFDGLICDTENAARESWREAYRGFGLDFPDGLWARMRGRHDGERLAAEHLGRLLGRPMTAREAEHRRTRKSELAHAQPLLPGVAALLAEAAGRGLPAAVVSSAPGRWVEPHLRRLGVRGRFRTVVTGDLPLPNKPAPDLYLHALAALGVRASGAVAFEDSVPGVSAAVAAALRCVAVPGAAAADPAAFAGAAAVVPSFESLSLASLERLFDDEFRDAPAA
ncbi:HAD-IA family hydrolase [Kitasatospora sp. NA04385]|uniref:HAD family hydrolase n=1 Tax=Kitasatospora sp. NA04385 TaxID=2742135 RepID=UPI001590DE93|nr:HAD-IA family hydrolase [Kitasatospora sp. NA04385]QKW20271.1 HAD-IA family hydrolase [Kitasatospora sp. NA04385]